MLLLWSATEGILRQFAARENVDLESPEPAYLTTLLYTIGLLGRDQYWVLDNAVRLRNQAAHGFEVPVTRKDLANLARVARALLNELEAKAA